MKTAKNAGFAKALLLKHGEKIGMLIFGAAAAWLLYASLGAEGINEKPTDLSGIVQTANGNIQRFTAADAPPPADDPTNAIADADTWEPIPAANIDPDLYQSRDNFVWGAPPLPPIVLRRDPVLLPAKELEGFGATAPLATMDEATRKRREDEMLRMEQQRLKERELERETARAEADRGGRGAGRGGERGYGGEMGRGYGGEMAGPAGDGRRPAPMVRRSSGLALNGDERVDLASYACVTALAPIKDQWQIYQSAFADALGYDAMRDQPKYLGYYVERKEVGVADAEWESVKFKDATTNTQLPVVSGASILRATSNWVPGLPPLVDGRYFHPDMTFPLPPIVGKSFGREVVHSAVPLQMETDAENATLDQNPEEDTPTGDTPADLLGGGPAGARGGYGGEMGGRGGYGGEMGGRGGYGGYGGYGGEMGGRGGYGGEMGGRGGYGGEMGGRGGYGGEMGGRGGARMSGGGEYVMSVPNVMVRFFDFSVQAGKRYRYRVQLLLEDPNSKGLVNINHLDKEAKQRVEQQTADGKTKFRKTEWSEPSKIISIPAAGEVYVAEVKPAPTRAAGGEPSVDLLVKSYDIDEQNRARQAEKILTFNRGAVLNRKVEDIEILEKNMLVTIDSFTFKTNVTLLDVQGGERIGRDVTSPGRVLLMDASGRLYVQDEFASKSDVEMHKLMFAEEQSGPGGYDEGGRGGERGYGGFEGLDRF